jgi:hypothetical protein
MVSITVVLLFNVESLKFGYNMFQYGLSLLKINVPSDRRILFRKVAPFQLCRFQSQFQRFLILDNLSMG